MPFNDLLIHYVNTYNPDMDSEKILMRNNTQVKENNNIKAVVSP